MTKINEDLKVIKSIEDLSIIPELKFEEENHIYRKSNIKMPSVTQVMKVLSGDIYGSIDPEILKNAANRGTNIHRACEEYDKYKFIGVSEEEKPYFNAYVNFQKDYNVSIIANEVKLFHKQLLYAGTLDIIANVNGRVTLIDIKTTAILHDKLVAVQLAGYLMELQSWNLTVEQSAVVQLKSNGEYVFNILNPDFNTFKACLQIQAYKNRKEN